jgi:hypothetical protein
MIMNNTKIETLITECKQIQEDSTYTADAHHIIADGLSKRAFWCKLIPVSITVVSAMALLLGVPNWVSWITLLSGTVTMLNVFMEPEKKARDHLYAAKNFTVLKHEARSLHECFKDFISSNEFYHSVKQLREKYNSLVQSTPPTTENSFEKARERIKRGVHEADFRSERK